MASDGVTVMAQAAMSATLVVMAFVVVAGGAVAFVVAMGYLAARFGRWAACALFLVALWLVVFGLSLVEAR